MFALSELWQLTDPNLKVEQDLCFGTLEKEKKEKRSMVKRSAEEFTAEKLGTYRSINICIL